jgi:hypothetical protein
MKLGYIVRAIASCLLPYSRDGLGSIGLGLGLSSCVMIDAAG